MNPDLYDSAMEQWERHQQLTEPQLRLLAEVRAKGTVTKNGRIARTALALVRAGLVVASWEPVAHANSMPTERWTITEACHCMVEDAGDGTERVLTHSLDCSLHPDYSPAQG